MNSIKLRPCPFCGYEDKETIQTPDTAQRLSQCVCFNCGSTGPVCNSQLEGIQAWNSDRDWIPVKRAKSKCMDCGWNGDNSEIKDMKRKGILNHWTCPQCDQKRLTQGEPIERDWNEKAKMS